MALQETLYPKTFCQALIDGQIYVYDLCRDIDTPPNEHFGYIGKGTIYAVDGVRQVGKTEHHFFVWLG